MRKASKSVWMARMTPPRPVLLPELVWGKKLTRSDAQHSSPRARQMRFLRLTKSRMPYDHKTWFRSDFFARLQWNPGQRTLEAAAVDVEVTILGQSLGIRTMRLSHEPTRARNNSAPTTHLHFDHVTRQVLEAQNLTGHSVELRRDRRGAFHLTVS